MKCQIKKMLIILFCIAFFFTSCSKIETSRPNTGILPPPPSQPGTYPCGTRPEINATLVPLSNLSSGRIDMQCASAGNKILFIGGWHWGQNWWNEPVPVDIYDIPSNSWSYHSLVPDNPFFTHFRYGAGITTLGNKIFFAGGGDGMGDNQSSRVDIYDVSTNSWAVKYLSADRQGLAAAIVGDKALFAGGFGYPDGVNWGYFNTVDIYDNNTDKWSTAILSEARMDLAATTSGNKVYFAGGRNSSIASKTIDIYDEATNSWSVSYLQIPRVNMASIAIDESIFWVGGSSSLTNSEWIKNNNVEILNTYTGAQSGACILGRRNITTAKKDDNIVFFTGSIAYNDPRNGSYFEIYNTTTKTWSVGKLNQKVYDAAVISVNNTIYVAGGTNGNEYFNQLWELKF